MVLNDAPDEFEIRPAPDRLPAITFDPVSEPKTVQNRLHLDLRPDDQEEEVARFLARAATRVALGQGADTPWVVLADPEGNEFCVLDPRRG